VSAISFDGNDALPPWPDAEQGQALHERSSAFAEPRRLTRSEREHLAHAEHDPCCHWCREAARLGSQYEETR